MRSQRRGLLVMLYGSLVVGGLLVGHVMEQFAQLFHAESGDEVYRLIIMAAVVIPMPAYLATVAAAVAPVPLVIALSAL